MLFCNFYYAFHYLIIIVVDAALMDDCPSVSLRFWRINVSISAVADGPARRADSRAWWDELLNAQCDKLAEVVDRRNYCQRVVRPTAFASFVTLSVDPPLSN